MLIVGAAAQSLRHRDYAAPPLHPAGSEPILCEDTLVGRVPLGSKKKTQPA